jgi:uncharacterized protein (TIGR03067 family)
MTAMLRIVLGSLLFASFLALAAGPEEALKPFQGEWVIESANLADKDHTELFKALKLTVTGEKYTIDFGENSEAGTIKLDATKSPKQIDLTTRKDGPFKGRNLPGIYEFKGDTVTLCLNSEKPERPAKFAAPAKTPLMLLTFKREKK